MTYRRVLSPSSLRLSLPSLRELLPQSEAVNCRQRQTEAVNFYASGRRSNNSVSAPNPLSARNKLALPQQFSFRSTPSYITMDKSAVVSLALLCVAMATVSAFGLDNQVPQFGGGDYNDRRFQSWLFKRGLGSGSPAFGSGFGLPLGDTDGRFFNWREFLSGDGIAKRQLNYGSGRFGNFRRYFTNGLQDWRNTYSGMKKKWEATPEDE